MAKRTQSQNGFWQRFLIGVAIIAIVAVGVYRVFFVTQEVQAPKTQFATQVSAVEVGDFAYRAEDGSIRVTSPLPKQAERLSIPVTHPEHIRWMQQQLIWTEAQEVQSIGGGDSQTATFVRSIDAASSKQQVPIHEIALIPGRISSLSASSTMPLLLFMMNGDLYSLNAESGVYTRIAERVQAFAWGNAGDVAVIAQEESTEYVEFSTDGRIEHRVTLMDTPQASHIGIAFQDASTVLLAAQEGDGEIALTRIALRDLSQTHGSISAMMGDGAESDDANADEQGVLTIIPSPSGEYIALALPGRFSEILSLASVFESTDAAPENVPSVDAAHVMQLQPSEMPLTWKNASTIILERQSQIVAYSIQNGLQTVELSGVSDPARLQ